ncbi:hypothetical protein N9S59_04080 [Pseudomonadota bacterium]|nr:hypothetical protein [Pseudomonadota bacterium]
MNLVELHPLPKQLNKPVQAELFSCTMKHDLIEKYQEKKKEYRYVLRHIDRMDAQHRDVKRLKKLDAKEIYDQNGLVQINVYRKEKKWSDLQIHVEELLQTRYEHKEALDKWFHDFAELLDLVNERDQLH